MRLQKLCQLEVQKFPNQNIPLMQLYGQKYQPSGIRTAQNVGL